MIQQANRRRRPLTDDERRLTDAERDFAGRHLKFAWRLAIARTTPGEPADDAAQAGVFGVLRAAQTFRPELGLKFTTYARWYVLQAIRRHQEKDHLVAPSAHPGRSCRIFGLNHLEVRVGDFSPTGSRVDREDAAAAVRRAVAALPEPERKVIEGRMRGEIYRDVGDRLGLSRDTARRVEARAHSRLRESLAEYEGGAA